MGGGVYPTCRPAPSIARVFVEPLLTRYRPGLVIHRSPVNLILAGACVLTAAGGPAAGRQEVQPAPEAQPAESPFDGRVVREIRIVRPVRERPGETEPIPEASAQLVRNNIRLELGRPYRRQTVHEDVTRLNRLGRFRRVETSVQPMDDGSVTVTYTLVEQPVIRDVQSVGNRLLTDQDIAGAVGVIIGTPVDRFQIDRAARAIEDLYRRKGYYLAQVTIDEGELEESGILIFRVREGDRVKVTDIRFDGNRSFTPRELMTAIRTREADLLFETGPLDDDVLTDDVAALVTFYRDRGYLDVRADRRVQPSPNNREAIVTFLIDEGPLYSLRSVQVLYTQIAAVQRYKADVLGRPDDQTTSVLTPEQARQVGAGVYTAEQIAGLMLIKPGDVYSADKLDKSITAIENAYANLGHYDLRIARREVRDVERPLVDLVLFIDEARPQTTGEVVIRGNSITRHEVISRQLRIRPERPLDKEAIEESRQRLEDLRLFEPRSIRLTVQPPSPEDPDRRDVLVEVKETNTGRFTFGAGVNSDLGVVGTLSLSEQNFDLSNPPDSVEDLISGGAFRGGGQTLNLTLQPGNRTQDYSLSLTEPYVLETDNSLTTTGFFRTRQYREFDEQRYGGRVILGRRFGTRWQGNVTWRNEWVDIGDISATSPADFFDVEDLNLVAGLGVEVARTTTDSRFRPGRGTRLELGAEQVGLGYGDFDFNRFEGRYAAFFTVHETFAGEKTVLSLSGRAGYIPQDPDEVPVYERYYLGGRSFRGFDFRTIAPKGLRSDGTQTNQAVGGTWLFFAGVELEQPVYRDIVSVVTFMDTGTVTEDVGFEDYRVSIGAGIRLNIVQLSPVPVALDFGFPVAKQFGDRERVFTFSIDLPY